MNKVFIILVTIICFTNNLYASKDRWDTDKSNWSELMRAIYNRNNNKVKQLINNDVDILYNAGGYFNLTAMDIAIFRENKIAVHELLKTGKITNIDRYLNQACMGIGNNIDIIKLLYEFGADVNFTDENGYNSIMYATSFGTIEIMNYLIEQNVDVNIGRRDGGTALILAAYNLDLNKIKILLQAGSNKTIKNSNGQTAYDIVIDNNYIKITKNKRNEILELLK